MQPDRGPKDGPVEVVLLGDDEICLVGTHKDERQSIVVSQYNAYRLFAMLALILEVPLPKKVAKSIKM